MVKEKIDTITNIKADITTIEGPEGVSKYIEPEIPKITENTARTDETTAISSGEWVSCLADAAGIINKDVIKSKPTILKDTATTIVISNIINNWFITTLIPSALASFSSIVIKTKEDQLKYRKINTKKPPNNM